MNPLRAGESDWFPSAARDLTVTGHIVYADGLLRYRVAGDPDIHCIDRFPQRGRERALNRVAAAEVRVGPAGASYLGAEFDRQASTVRSAETAAGELGDIAPMRATIEETVYTRAGAGAKSLLSVTAGAVTAWYLVTEPQTGARAFAERAIGAPSLSKYRSSELVSIAAYLYLAGSILHGRLSHPADSYYFWSETIQGLMVFEFILVTAGAMSAMMSMGVQERGTGKVVPAPLWVPIVFLVFGLVYGLNLFKFSLLFLIYMARLITLIWTGLTVPAERAQEMIQRRGLGAMAYVASLGLVIPKFGNGAPEFMVAGVIYFSALALIEVVMLLRRPSADG